MPRRIWIEVTETEKGVSWSTSIRDEKWLESLGFQIDMVELHNETWTTYHEYLRTSQWDRTRTRALERADHRCQVCNAGRKPLDVHHRTYDRLGQELDGDVIALCRDCHTLFHGSGKLARG
jgi:hypothetical protein